MTAKLCLRTVRRPETGVGYVGQHGEVRAWHLRDGVHRLVTVSGTQKALAVVVKERILFQVVRPIGDLDHIVSLPVRFDRVLVNR